MAENNKKVAVVTIEVPWRNIDCLGVYDDIEQANKAAGELAESFFELTNDEYTFEPIDCLGETYALSKDGNDGYEFLYLEYPGYDCCYIRIEDNYTGDVEIKGPFKDHEEANRKVFRKGSKMAFVQTAGTLGPGFYPVEGRTKTYTYLPICDTKGGN